MQQIRTYGKNEKPNAIHLVLLAVAMQEQQKIFREIGFDSKRITRTWQERVSPVEQLPSEDHARSGDQTSSNESATPVEQPQPEQYVTKTFQACLGAGVTVEDYTAFSKKYDEIISRLFSKAGIKQEKLVYKGAELRKLFWMTGIDPVNELFSELTKHVSFVDVYYSYFLCEDETDKGRHTKPLKIGIFGLERDKSKYIDGIEFLDIVEPAHSLICAWAFLRLTPVTSNIVLEVDTGSIKPCKAASELIAFPNLHIFERGDQTNYIISAADIFVSAIDNRLSVNATRLSKTLIDNFPELSNRIDAHFIGSKWLFGIKPTHSFDISLSHKIAHPLFVLFTPGANLFGQYSKAIFEGSPLVAEVYKTASRKRGNVKFFGKDDIKLLTDEDYLVVHDEDSQKKAEQLISMGVPSKIIKKEEVSNL